MHNKNLIIFKKEDLIGGGGGGPGNITKPRKRKIAYNVPLRWDIFKN